MYFVCSFTDTHTHAHTHNVINTGLFKKNARKPTQTTLLVKINDLFFPSFIKATFFL